MGKHDKHETEFKWEVPKDDFYKARLTELKNENARLREELTEKERSIGAYEQTVDYQDEMHTGVLNEYKQLLDEKDDEIAVLQGQIKMLKEAVVNGALREVLA
jgi:sugar-specific transcriptional regulator TrmB